MRWTWFVAGAVAVLVVASIWYVQAPPRTAESYRERAAATSEALRSQVQTARLWAGAFDEGKAMRPALVVAFRETEADAEAAVSRFAGYDPPGGTQQLRSDVTAIGAEVMEALAALRIAAEDEEWGRIARLADRLGLLADRLTALEAAARP